METKFILKWLGYVLALLRAVLCITTMAIFLLLMLVTLTFAPKKRRYTDWWKRFWCNTACLILGIQLKVEYEEQPLPDNYLAVSNHVSFMDPAVSLAVLKGMPVAKAEIEKYPLIGYAAKKTGIIWVKRENIASRAVAKTAVENALKNNQSVLVYPEGTLSHSPTQLRRFKKGVFDAAIKAETDIVFVAIYYETDHAFWKEDNTMVEQLFQHFSVWRHTVHIHISSPRQFESPAEGAEFGRNWIQHSLQGILEAAKVN